MSSATVAATDNRTRCDAIRHWLTPHRLHCIVLAAYVIVVDTVMCFHEPWFDEAQAWLIARDCSWREMILERPHYEGHPPLWWMMLAAPAKLGVPYEIGLKSINLTCATLMIWLLEFKTKLPEPFKVILPFSYFLCYQYGVTSRPYALMVAAMLLVAINWKTRDEKPWREALSMMLLCLTSSYGLVIAGMFAANWVVRFVWQEHSLIRNRRRFIALLALLAAAMAILIDVMPAKDVYSGNFDISGMTSRHHYGYKSAIPGCCCRPKHYSPRRCRTRIWYSSAYHRHCCTREPCHASCGPRSSTSADVGTTQCCC